MKRMRFKKAGFNTKLIVDVIGASLIVQKAPLLIDMIIPLDPSVRAIAGVGAGYLIGSMINRPDLANASIALGAVDFVSPFVDDLLGGGTAPGIIPASSSVLKPANTQMVQNKALESYFNLNDYVSNPGMRVSYDDYRGAYSY